MRHDDEIARRGVEGDTSWALTASGKKLVFLKPKVGDIVFYDIALHLSRLCRFTGAPTQFYSVAQHCILVSQLVREILDKECVDDQSVEYWDQILAALFHDAEEYVTGDVSSPLKAAMQGKYNWIAAGIRKTIYARFNIDWAYHNAIIKAGDNKAILIERYYLMPDHPGWPKITKKEMVYVKPRLMGSEAARVAYTKVVRQAISVRNALQAEVS